MRALAIALSAAALAACLLAADAQAQGSRSMWRPVITQVGPGVQSDRVQVANGYTRYQVSIHSHGVACVRISGRDGTVPVYFPAGTHKLIVYLPAWSFRVHTASSHAYVMTLSVWRSTVW